MVSKSFVLTAKNVNDFTRVVFLSGLLFVSPSFMWVVIMLGCSSCRCCDLYVGSFRVCSYRWFSCVRCASGLLFVWFSSCGLFFMWVVLHVGGVSCGVFFVWVVLRVVVLYVCRGHVFNVRVVWFIPFVDT